MFIRILKAVVAIAALLVIGFYAGVLSERGRDTNSPAAGNGNSNPVISRGEAAIGGAFTLQNPQGETVTDEDLLGKYALVYFGYTNCPDVCPIDMNRISAALNALEERVDLPSNLQPVFISVDPERDTPEQVGEFIGRYHPSFIGLTGTKAQMEKAADAYKVAYEKILQNDHETGLMQHSSHIYLMDPDGKYIKHYGPGITASALADDLQDTIG